MESNVMNKVWEAYAVLLQWEVDEFLQVAGTTNKPEAKSASEALFEARMLLQEALRNLRNCDVGTALDQSKRFMDFCRPGGRPPNCEECKVYPNRMNKFWCQLEWAQMPYEPDMKKEERNNAE